MKMFENFNPLEAAPKNAPTNDPRNLATPTYQEAPKRGVDIPENSDSYNPASQQKSAIDVMDEVWNTDPAKLPKDPELQTVSAEKFAEASKAFTPTFSQEELEEAQNSPAKMQELLAKAAQQGLAASANMSSQVTANYLEQERTAAEARMKRHLTMTSVMNEVRTLNPSLTSGPFKDFTESLVGKYMATHPDVSSKEAAELVNRYVSEKLNLTSASSKEGKEDKDGNNSEASHTNWVDFSKAVSY